MPIFENFIAPGKTLPTAVLLLTLSSMFASILLFFTTQYFKQNWILVHGGIALFSAIVLKMAVHFDPRKPLNDLFWVIYGRNFAIFVHFMDLLSFFIWTKLPFDRNDGHASDVVVLCMQVIHLICFIHYFYIEIREYCGESIVFEVIAEIMFSVFKILVVVYQYLGLTKEYDDFFLMLKILGIPVGSTVFTIWILGIYAGLYREVVRRPRPQIELVPIAHHMGHFPNVVQVPLTRDVVVVELGPHLEREPPEDFDVVVVELRPHLEREPPPEDFEVV